MHPVFPKTPVVLAALLLPAFCLAERVQIPFQLDHHFIEMLLHQQVFTGPGGSVRINDDGSGCQYLALREPQVRTSDNKVILRTLAEARAGRAVGGRCLLVLDWHGQLELIQQPLVGDDDKSILLRTASWRTLRPDGEPAPLSTTIAQWLEQFLPSDLRQTRISFSRPIDELQSFLALMVSPEDHSRTDAMFATMALDRVAADDDRATVTVGMDAPPVVVPPQRVEPALSAEELVALDQRLDSLDAFFTYTMKSVTQGSTSWNPDALLAVLVELRRELVAVLGAQQQRAEDPTRRLFMHAWDGLAPLLRAAAEQQPDQESALHYLTFIGAGDALRALDDLGPAAGIEISTDGLRRLARILLPGEPGDPLWRDDGVDPQLRRSMGFGDPLPPPQVYDDTSWLDWLVPRALAASSLNPATVKRLNNWVPKPTDMPVYLPMVRDVLRHVVTEQLRANELDRRFHDVYRWLVFTAAWQESCWRQFVAKNAKRVPMQSGSGDVGMMQINPRVWRGFYDLQGLRWDIVYNARAGADILEHHMINYAIRNGEHRTTGASDSLARSAYAAYNGGPRQYDRYRRKGTSAHDRKIDDLFYTKYRDVKGGRELAVTGCYQR